MITQEDLQSLVNAASITGFEVNVNEIKLEVWIAGIETHIPKALDNEYSAVYIFEYGNEYLKVGKVNSKTKERYRYHHYNLNSSGSNLSKSISTDLEMSNVIGDTLPGQWLKENTTRYNIKIPSHMRKNFVNFAEAFFILKCNPKYEGR